MLPTVDFLGLNPTRLILGANPFGGFSHQNKERDQEMVAYYTVERIKETWARAETAGINTMITNNTTPHVMQAVREYLADGGALQWIGQLSHNIYDDDMCKAIDVAVDIGACAAYIHGGAVDQLYTTRDADTLRTWLDHGRSRGIPMGVAGHAPEAHLWIDSLAIADFHVVCFYNCGSLHNGKGDKFRLEDIFPAIEAIKKIDKPCIGYKIMAAGRIDPVMAFEFAFENIKPGDVVNVGMHRGDKDDMVEENVATAGRILT
ncbi:MAG: hypothetical protein KAI66_03910 [Lentisphaeria bacterium]|nr:hypothetical protein [Lentisphaeria bacterium]